jgi:hypothetical protein
MQSRRTGSHLVPVLQCTTRGGLISQRDGFPNARAALRPGHVDVATIPVPRMRRSTRAPRPRD